MVIWRYLVNDANEVDEKKQKHIQGARTAISINQFTNGSVNQSNQPIKSTNQPITHSTHQSTIHSTQINQSTAPAIND